MLRRRHYFYLFGYTDSVAMLVKKYTSHSKLVVQM